MLTKWAHFDFIKFKLFTGRIWCCNFFLNSLFNKCGQSENQIIQSTLYSENYPNSFSNEDFTCTWKLKSPPGTRIVLDFDDNFDFGDGQTACLYFWMLKSVSIKRL